MSGSGARYFHDGAAVWLPNQTILFCGGSTHNGRGSAFGMEQSCSLLDPGTGNATTAPSLPVAVENLQMVAVGSEIYALGGMS